jgi:hypothetical protein
MVYLHTPYLKLDDAEPDPVAWNGKSKKTSLADCNSNSGPGNHSDLDKVNILQAKLFKWLFKVGSNHTTGGICSGETCGTASQRRVSYMRFTRIFPFSPCRICPFDICFTIDAVPNE